MNEPKAVVGREMELAAVGQLLADARAKLALLLLEGDPGIGKTTVFLEAQRLAQDAGFAVLASRPRASESTLSLSVVADVLQAIPATEWAGLPAVQRHALEVVLHRRSRRRRARR